MKRRNLAGGTILVLLGILILLDNFNIIRVHIWGLIWPLLLIWVGVQFLLRPRWQAMSPAGKQIALPIKGIEEAVVRIDYGAGQLHLHGDTAPDELMEGSFGTGLVYDLKANGTKARLKMRPPSEDPLSWFGWKSAEGRRWSFGLNDAIPISLDLHTGASEATLDLEALNLKSFTLHTGASETRVTLPAHAGFTQVKAETGMASVSFTVPQGVAARIRASGGLSEIKVDQTRFPRSAGVYQSTDYDTADNKVDIELAVGMGSAHIN